jgi:hypothetical protein
VRPLQGGTCGLQAGGDGGGAVIVESHPVDHGAVLHQPEQPRLLVAGLGLPRDGANFHVAEPQLGEGFDAKTFLVETRGEPERRREGHAKSRGLQRRRRSRQFLQDFSGAGSMREPDALETDFVGALGVHP